MTGYSRMVRQSSGDPTGAPLTVAIRSVNRRNLEISCLLPPFLAPREPAIKGWVAEQAQRGYFQVRIDWPLPQTSSPNLPLLKELKGVAEAIRGATDLPFPEAFKLACRGREGELTTSEDIEVDEQELEEGVKGALKNLLEMREAEGAAIQVELHGRCQTIQRWIGEVEERVAAVPERIRERLTERLKEWEVDEERMVREVALLAEKACVAEELARLRYHLRTLLSKLEGAEQASGKTCELVVQEMAREANTLGAKAQDANTSEIVVEIKGELEKMKEQLANVE